MFPDPDGTGIKSLRKARKRLFDVAEPPFFVQHSKLKIMIRKTLSSVLFLLLLPDRNLPAQAWTTFSSLPKPAIGFALAEENSRVTIIGGEKYSLPIAAGNFKFLYGGSAWTSMKNMPISLTNSVAETVNGKLYVIGGFDGIFTTGIVLQYNFSTNTWSYKSSMPTPRKRAGSCVVNGKIYVMGGILSNNTATTTVEIYDPVSDSWATGTSLLAPSFDPLCTTIGQNQEKIFLCGGRLTPSGSAPWPWTLIFDTGNNSWSMAAPSPVPVYDGGIDYDPIMDQVYIVSGYETGGKLSKKVSIFFYGSNAWYSGIDLPVPTAGGRLAWATDGNCKVELFFFGGITATTDTSAWVGNYILYYIFPAEIRLSGEYNGESATLSWKHLEDGVKKQYELERRDVSGDFREIAIIENDGREDYKVIDKFLHAGENHYRVGSRNLDGTIHYSNTVSIYHKGAKFFASIFPNPTDGNIWIDYGLKSDQAELMMEIFDPLGRLIASKSYPPPFFGNLQEMDLGFLEPGTYFVSMKSGMDAKTEKVILK